MQSKRERIQQQMMLLPPLESFIPADHYLLRLSRVLDLGFVHDLVREKYCQDNGRPSIDPEVIIRLFLIQAINGIPHVRELMRQVQVNLAYRWFIGYELDEKLPDHSTLSKALDRFGDKVFDELFERSVAQCQRSGLVEGRVLHVDATTIRADIDSNRVGKPDSSDHDARFGKFPGKRTAPGYKQHTVADGKARVVLSLSVTPANRSEHDEALSVIDDAVSRLDTPPDAVCADAAYASGKNAASMEDRGLRLVSPPPKARTYTKDRYYTVEEFSYDEEHDRFSCPAEKQLKYVRTEKQRGRKIYRAHRTDCRNCPLKSQCTQGKHRELKVTCNHASLIRLRADSRTDSFKELYRSRAPVIEGVFAESKQWHSLGRAWRRGLSKMRVQCLLVAAVINLKRPLIVQTKAIVSIVNPMQIAAFAKVQLRRCKTDSVDAQVICSFAELMKPRTWSPDPEPVRKLYELVNQADAIRASLGQWQNRHHAQRFIADLPDAVKKSQRAIERSLITQLKRIETAIANLCASDSLLAQQVALLCTIPGVANNSAAKLLAYGRDWLTNRNPKALTAHAGLAPHHKLSGTSVRGESRIDKHGDHRLRRTLYMPALVGIVHNPRLKTFYQHLLKQGKPKMVALIACMGKLLMIIRAMLTKKEPFNPIYSH